MIKEKENFPPKRESTSPDGAWRTVERKIRVTGSSHGGTENAQPPGPRRGRSQAARVLAQTAALVPQTGWRSPLMPTPHREGFLSHRSRPHLGWEDPLRRKWQPTPVLLPGKFCGLRSLVGYSPWGRKESDTTEQLHFTSLHFTSLQWEMSLKGGGIANHVGVCRPW